MRRGNDEEKRKNRRMRMRKKIRWKVIKRKENKIKKRKIFLHSARQKWKNKGRVF